VGRVAWVISPCWQYDPLDNVSVVLPPHLQHPIAVLAIQTEATTYLLVYTLAKKPEIHATKPHWRFSKKQVRWLYDEFDIDSRGNQQHEVLLSNGKIIKLRFRDVQLMTDKCDADLDVA